MLKVFVSRLRAFVTGVTTQPRKDGVDADDDDASQSRRLWASGSGERVDRAKRDVVAPGSWLKTAGTGIVLLPTFATISFFYVGGMPPTSPGAGVWGGAPFQYNV